MTVTSKFAAGDRVEWASSTTGEHHTGTVVAHTEVDGVQKVLLRPDGRAYLWRSWEPESVVSAATV